MRLGASWPLPEDVEASRMIERNKVKEQGRTSSIAAGWLNDLIPE